MDDNEWRGWITLQKFLRMKTHKKDNTRESKLQILMFYFNSISRVA